MSDIALVVAMATNRVIGNNNRLPWHLPADLKHFKRITMGKPILMGRRTYESIGKPLPGRKNIVITRNADWRAEGVCVARSLPEALMYTKSYPEVMVVGGSQLYANALPLAQRLYITQIECVIDGDTIFPDWNKTNWREISCEKHCADEKNPYAYRFMVYERKRQ